MVIMFERPESDGYLNTLYKYGGVLMIRCVSDSLTIVGSGHQTFHRGVHVMVGTWQTRRSWDDAPASPLPGRPWVIEFGTGFAGSAISRGPIRTSAFGELSVHSHSFLLLSLLLLLSHMCSGAVTFTTLTTARRLQHS